MKIEDNANFGTRECPSCATEVPVNNNRCPICGYEFPQPTPRQRIMKTGGALLMLLLFVAVYLGACR